MADNKVELIVPESLTGNRADHVISILLNDYSRSRIKQWIENGFVLIGNKKITPKQKLISDERIIVYIQADDKELQYKPENIDIEVIYYDEDIAVINKRAGLVVHPADGNWSGTLLNGILNIFPNNKLLPRAGIVHRLDKETSGLLVIALNEISQLKLIQQLQAKTIYREYRAIIWGNINAKGFIDEPVGRHPKNRIKMSVNKINGKNAVTKYEPIENFEYHTYLKCILETGRTHQIRVHMQHIKKPLVGDPVYGFKKILPFKGISKKFIDMVTNFPRQALHAKKLELIHPKTNKKMSWEVKLPDDFSDLLNALRETPSVGMDHEQQRTSYDTYKKYLDKSNLEDFEEDDF